MTYEYLSYMTSKDYTDRNVNNSCWRNLAEPIICTLETGMNYRTTGAQKYKNVNNYINKFFIQFLGARIY